MKIQLKPNTNHYEDESRATYCVFLNGKEVGNDANNVSLSNIWGEHGFKTINVDKKKYGYEIITGETKTGKTYEIFGGRKAGGMQNQWWLDVDGTCVAFGENAKELIQFLVCFEWTDKQISFSNSIYKRGSN